MNTPNEVLTTPPAEAVPATRAASSNASGPNFEVLPPPAASGSSQPTEALPAPPPRKLTRNGKIARLPKLQRDMVSRMLRNNIPHAHIVEALAELDIIVTERNVSNWKTRGGYREWCQEQDQAVHVRVFQDNMMEYLRTQDASQIPEVGLQLLATCFSEHLLNPESRRQITANPDKYTRLITTLCRLTNQLHTLQKHRDDSVSKLGWKHRPAYVKEEDLKTVESVRKDYSSAYGPDPEDQTRHRNYLPLDGRPQ